MADSAHGEAVVLAVGSIHADLKVRVAEPLRLGSSYVGCDLLRASGGNGANVAVLASRLGAGVRLSASVGDDDPSHQPLARPHAAGVDLGAVRVTGGATGFAANLFRSDGNKIIAVASGANDAFRDQDNAALVIAIHRASEPAVLVADLEVPPEPVGYPPTCSR